MWRGCCVLGGRSRRLLAGAPCLGLCGRFRSLCGVVWVLSRVVRACVGAFGVALACVSTFAVLRACVSSCVCFCGLKPAKVLTQGCISDKSAHASVNAGKCVHARVNAGTKAHTKAHARANTGTRGSPGARNTETQRPELTSQGTAGLPVRVEAATAPVNRGRPDRVGLDRAKTYRTPT